MINSKKIYSCREQYKEWKFYISFILCVEQQTFIYKDLSIP